MKFKVGDKVYVRAGAFNSLKEGVGYTIQKIRTDNSRYPYEISDGSQYPCLLAEEELSMVSDSFEYAALIRQWAEDRNLIEGSDSFRQLAKLTEEVGELAGAIAKGNKEGIKDGIGDAFVVLTILAAQQGFSVEDCIAAAYNEIKDRKGRMVDGVFIKEEAS